MSISCQKNGHKFLKKEEINKNLYAYVYSNLNERYNYLEKVINNGKFTAGVIYNHKPFTYLENNNPKGFNIDIINKIAEEINAKVNFVEIKENMLIDILNKGNIDIIVSPYNPTIAKDKLIDFSFVYYKDYYCVMLDKNLNINSMKDLEYKKISMFTGTISQKFIDEYKIKPVYLDSIEKHRYALTNNKVSAILALRSTLLNIKENTTSSDNYIILDTEFGFLPYSFGLPSGEPEWRDFINHSIMKLVKQEIYHKLYKKYFGNDINIQIDDLW
ncbi:MAG: substrate-binding periplasmic protein [Spirochaetota bacterium]